MVLLSTLIDELRENIDHNKNLLQLILNKNPNMAYFPDTKKISHIESYGEENIGIVIDKFRKKFPIPRESIKLKAIEIMGNNIQAQDAYMYEGKEGVKIIFEKGRIEVLPGSCHFWCKIDERVKSYGDWLMKNVYLH
jgi:hypothetical protein